jgi:hypothetical protein
MWPEESIFCLLDAWPPRNASKHHPHWLVLVVTHVTNRDSFSSFMLDRTTTTEKQEKAMGLCALETATPEPRKVVESKKNHRQVSS